MFGVNRVKMPLCCAALSRSVVSNFLQPHGLEPSKLLCPWNSPGKNTGLSNLSFFQGIFLTQELNQGLLHCRKIFNQLSYQRSTYNATVLCLVSHVGLFATPWTEAHQAPLSMGFSQARILGWVAIPFSGGSSWRFDLDLPSLLIPGSPTL